MITQPDPGFPAPAVFLAPTIFAGEPYVLAQELWNLTADVPGHPKGSTVTRGTLEALGYQVPHHAWLGAPTPGPTAGTNQSTGEPENQEKTKTRD